MKTIFAAALFALFSNLSFAHGVDDFVPAEPPYDETPVIAAMRYCQTVGVRAAWGAQARFLGAAATFKYIQEAPLKKMFMGSVADIPNDAIYVLEDMNLEERRQYEEVAFHGWKQADKWVKDGKERPEFEVLVAIFYNDCKNELIKPITK